MRTPPHQGNISCRGKNTFAFGEVISESQSHRHRGMMQRHLPNSQCEAVWRLEKSSFSGGVVDLLRSPSVDPGRSGTGNFFPLGVRIYIALAWSAESLIAPLWIRG